MATVVHGDVLVSHGRVLDPRHGLDTYCDVLVKSGRVLALIRTEHTHIEADHPAMKPKGTTAEAKEVVDASDCIVTPGLIDIHVHVYEAVTPLGIPPDETCLGRGVTTVLDAGSAGATMMPGLKKFIAKQSRTRVLALVNIALEGLSWAGMAGGAKGGELDNLNQVRHEAATQAIKDDPDFVLGVKIRLTADIANEGKSEAPAYDIARRAARDSGRFLMTHHAISTIGLEKCPGEMQPGDIYTHMYHGWPSTILQPDGDEGDWKIDEHVLEARKRGVLFDVGHGAGAFNWTVAEKCTRLGFWPDTISTDLHKVSVVGPAYDLVTVMSKMLHLGMPIEQIVKAVTCTAAVALGGNWCEEIGHLGPGACGDVTVLKVEPVDVQLEDCHKQVRRVRQRIRAKAVLRDGQLGFMTEPEVWPNPNSGRPSDLAGLVVRDEDWEDVMKQYNCC